MSSGAGEVLADVRREEDGEMYALCWTKERLKSAGGVGDRESSERSESEMSEEGAGLRGELGSAFSVQRSMVKKEASPRLTGIPKQEATDDRRRAGSMGNGQRGWIAFQLQGQAVLIVSSMSTK